MRKIKHDMSWEKIIQGFIIWAPEHEPDELISKSNSKSNFDRRKLSTKQNLLSDIKKNHQINP